jgi:hypothetical protein
MLAAASFKRAEEIQSNIRVVKKQPTHTIANLLDALFSRQVKGGGAGTKREGQ